MLKADVEVAAWVLQLVWVLPLLWILVTVSPLPAVALARGAVSVALADATWCAAKGPSVSHPPQPSGLANSE